jgi:ParB family chromosome partitioning protein
MMEVPTSHIVTGKRHREVCPAAVDRLAASMSEVGLRHPVTVRIVDGYVTDEGEVCDGAPVLVAGAHRLAAAIKLGWDKIACYEIEGDELTAELWELAENLHRLDLTKDQRDQHIRRYAELLVTRAARTDCPTSLADGRKAGPQHMPGVASQIAQETGLSQRTVRRALNPQPAPEPKNPLPDHDVVTVQFNSLVAAWNRAGREARDMFMDHIDAPVFDNTRAA